MKLVKMSLAAAMLMGASAFALENVEISGAGKLFYAATDSGDASLFDKDGAYADSAVNVKATAGLVDGVTAGVSFMAVSTLGLENNLVSATWTGAHSLSSGPELGSFKAELVEGEGPVPVQVDDASWFNEAWIAATMGKTTAKVGRMELDTPLAFSEQWNIAANSFDAAVLLNQDLPDTTLVAAWVGKGNGTPSVTVGENGSMNTFAIDGAYAYAIVNNSFKPLTVQAWYYDVVRASHAFWLQADLNMEGIVAGAQYTQLATTGKTSALDDAGAYAVKLGYEADTFTISAAYSSTDDDGWTNVANVATGHTEGSQTKLYTEAWWNYGYVGRADTNAFNITATTTVAGFGLGAYYTSSSTKDYVNPDKEALGDVDMTDLTLEVTKSFGPLDTGLYWIMTDADDQNKGDAYNTLQVYLTLNF